MPYIKQEDRKVDHYALSRAAEEAKVQGPGFVNYVITTFLSAAYDLGNPSYKKINEAIGVLECVKLELYRRVAAGYEDIKCAENGDVYAEGTGLL